MDTKIDNEWPSHDDVLVETITNMDLLCLNCRSMYVPSRVTCFDEVTRNSQQNESLACSDICTAEAFAVISY
jgi:hypothetical protein